MALNVLLPFHAVILHYCARLGQMRRAKWRLVYDASHPQSAYISAAPGLAASRAERSRAPTLTRDRSQSLTDWAMARMKRENR